VPEIKDILSGDQRCGSKMIRMIEDCDPEGFELLKQLYPHAGNAFVIGITGAPGAGKSTLIDALISSSHLDNIGGEAFQIASGMETTVGEMTDNLIHVMERYGIKNIKVLTTNRH
jgi:ribosome biogenesis GTPase A